MRFTHFLNVVKQAESEGLVSSRNYALPLLVNIGTLNTCQNKSLFCLFSNAPVSPIAGLADRVPLLTSVLPSYRRNAIAKSLKFFTSLQAVTSCCFMVFKAERLLKLTEYVHLAHYDRKFKLLRHELFSSYMLKAPSCLKDGMMR